MSLRDKAVRCANLGARVAETRQFFQKVLPTDKGYQSGGEIGAQTFRNPLGRKKKGKRPDNARNRQGQGGSPARLEVAAPFYFTLGAVRNGEALRRRSLLMSGENLGKHEEGCADFLAGGELLGHFVDEFQAV